MGLKGFDANRWVYKGEGRRRFLGVGVREGDGR